MVRSRLLTAPVVAALLVTGCGGEGTIPAARSVQDPASESSTAAAQAESSPSPPVTTEPPSPGVATESSPASTRAVPAVSGQDLRAGVLERTVPGHGSGRTQVVPGTQPAPGDGELQRVRVEVEGGLPVDAEAFATMVMSTLNDPRSWAGDGWTFARTDGDADIVVRLAGPDLSERLCRPLRTGGTLSCRSSEGVILTHYRWVTGQRDYGDDLTGYRQYLVNHEVGHALGESHRGCPGPGELAPAMQQQTKDVDPCRANPWPNP